MPSFAAKIKILHARYRENGQWVNDYYAFQQLKEGALGAKLKDKPIFGNPYFITCDINPEDLKPTKVKEVYIKALYNRARDEYDRANKASTPAPKSTVIKATPVPKRAPAVIERTPGFTGFTDKDARAAYDTLYRIYSRLNVIYTNQKDNQAGIEKRVAFRDLLAKFEQLDPQTTTLQNIVDTVKVWKTASLRGIAKTNYEAVSTSTGYTHNFFINPTSQRGLDRALESMEKKLTPPEPGCFSFLTGK